MRFLTVVLIVALLAGVAWAVVVGPYYLDAWKMEDVAGNAAASWAAYDEQRGRTKLRDEMRIRKVGEYLTEDLCTFYEDATKVKVVDCSWYVDVEFPVIGVARRYRFRVTKSADVDGRLIEG